MEREIIYNLYEYLGDLGRGVKIVEGFISAFTIDKMPGFVFIEATAPNLLSTIVARSRLPSFFFGFSNAPIVTPEERVMLLSGGSHDISVPTWVRFKSGLYKGDLGCVRRYLARSSEIQAFVVPRWDPLRGLFPVKGGRNRPPPKLFRDVNWLSNRVGSEKLKEVALMYKSHKISLSSMRSNGGLHVVTFRRNEVVSAEPKVDELGPFDVVSDSVQRWKRIRSLAMLRGGDRVRFISGEMIGLTGRLRLVDGEKATVRVNMHGVNVDAQLQALTEALAQIDDDSLNGGIQHVCALDDLDRDFKIGDHVRTLDLCGIGEGRTGFIVEFKTLFFFVDTEVGEGLPSREVPTVVVLEDKTNAEVSPSHPTSRSTNCIYSSRSVILTWNSLTLPSFVPRNQPVVQIKPSLLRQL